MSDSNTELSPIVVFIYRRPDHLRHTLSSLMKCKGFSESPIIVYADGARNEGEKKSVGETRGVAQALLGSRAEYHFSDNNLGLSRSVIQGVSEVLARFGRIIVVEDDLILSPVFLTYMNAALTKYQDINNVMQISGHMFDVPDLEKSNEGFFLPFTTSWGWATWKRSWDFFDKEAKGWKELQSNLALKKKFNLDESFDYYTMLKNQMNRKSDSWAIRWYWSVFKENGLILYPPQSLVNNVGFDGSGTHGWRSAKNKLNHKLCESSLIHLPTDVVMNSKYYSLVKSKLSTIHLGVVATFRSIMKNMLPFKR